MYADAKEAAARVLWLLAAGVAGGLLLAGWLVGRLAAW